MREESSSRNSSTQAQASDEANIIGEEPLTNAERGLFSLFRRQRSRDVSLDRKIEGSQVKLSDNNQSAVVAECSVAVECASQGHYGTSGDRSTKPDKAVNVEQTENSDISDRIFDNTTDNIMREEGEKQHEDEGRDCKSEVHFNSTKRFNWFGVMRPKRRNSSCNENDVCLQESNIDKQEVIHMNQNMVEDRGKEDGRCSEGESSDEAEAEEKILHDGEDDTQCVANTHTLTKDHDECEFFIKTETPPDGTFALWQRRQRLKRKLQIDGPIVARERSHISMKMLGVSQMEVGGGRNEENLRSLELEADLIDNDSDRKMRKMDIMSTEEKEQEDLLFDMWLDDCLLMAGEEPYDGYDHLGWYSTLTQREDGEADLECMDSYVMDVGTENDASDKKSNPWLDGIGNAALFIFAPDLYLIQRMNDSSFQPQYQVTSTVEDEENENPPQGWFRKILTKEGRGKTTKEVVILAS